MTYGVEPLEEGVGSLVCGAVAVLGMFVALCTLHVREHVLSRLLET